MYKLLKVRLLIIVSFVLLNVSPVFAADSTIIATKDKITALNVPSNGTLITALYNNEKLLESKMYSGSDIITADFGNDMSASIDNADTVKVFLWDIEKLLPLCGNFESLLSDLPEKIEESNKAKITAGGKEFTATLEDNETVNL